MMQKAAELYLGPLPEAETGGDEPRYHVRLPVFDGPLDLLLHLIRKNEVDIYDIPIADITRQYLEMLDLMTELNLNVAGDFVFMAATLIHIKSKMLLPPPHEDGTEDDAGDDPRAELVARLLEYQRYKEAAQLLHEKETIRNAMWVRPESIREAMERERDEAADGEELIEVDLFELISAFRGVLERARQRKDIVIERDAISVEEMIRRLTARVPPGATLQFEELFEGVATKSMLIVTFLALLEMVRLKVLRLYQQRPFGTIHVTRPVPAPQPAVELPSSPSANGDRDDAG